jgi:hypothetical protein
LLLLGIYIAMRDADMPVSFFGLEQAITWVSAVDSTE